MTHAELVDRAVKWLRNHKRCSVVIREMRVIETQEQPDALGFKGQLSYVIECVASRKEFRADIWKPFRRIDKHGVGARRYYMAPAGLLKPSEIPNGWGLLEVSGRCVSSYPVRSDIFIYRDHRAEIAFLVSALRRRGKA
jgi:hypothetical protein